MHAASSSGMHETGRLQPWGLARPKLDHLQVERDAAPLLFPLGPQAPAFLHPLPELCVSDGARLVGPSKLPDFPFSSVTWLFCHVLLLYTSELSQLFSALFLMPFNSKLLLIVSL